MSLIPLWWCYCIAVTDFDSIADFCLNNDVNLLIVGPEDPLVKGISNYFSSNSKLKHIAVIGPSKQGALLEGSKKFAKEFMFKHNVPTAKYESFNENKLANGLKFLEDTPENADVYPVFRWYCKYAVRQTLDVSPLLSGEPTGSPVKRYLESGAR